MLMLLVLLLSGVLLDYRLEDLGDVLGVQTVILESLLELCSLFGVRLEDRVQLGQGKDLLQDLLRLLLLVA